MTKTLYGFPIEDSINFILYDLTSGDLSDIEIKKSYHGNCYITDDKGLFYSGFILNRKKMAQHQSVKFLFTPPVPVAYIFLV